VYRIGINNLSGQLAIVCNCPHQWCRYCPYNHPLWSGR